MKRFVFYWGLMLGSLIFSCAALWAGEIQLAENGKTDYVITLPENPTAVQQTAARELAKYLNQITGAEFPILSEAEITPNAKQLAIGPSKITAALLADLGGERDDYAYDAVRIAQCGESVVLTGHRVRGMIYAVHTFLENDLGCRWWTAEEAAIPKNASPKICVTPVDYAPKLISREVFYRGIISEENADFAVKMKCNGSSNPIPDELGGHHQYQYFVHSFYFLIPPEKYFLDHPDWFSEIDGVRKVGPEANLSEEFRSKLKPEQINFTGTQLCLTNEEMFQEMLKNALEALKENPKATIISISQNDWYGPCTCEKCRAVDEEEGSHAGTMLRFVNRMAEEIEKVYPDIYVDTLAYQYARKPPKHVHARDNVIVRLCSIECAFGQPLETGPQNTAFADDMRGWSEKASNIFIWDYVTNFMQFMLPHPNYRIWKDNIDFFVNHHTIGLFEQGDYGLNTGDFVQLRAWVMAKLLWNPERDPQSLIDEFVAGYYAPELVPVYRAYFDILSDACEKSGVFLNIFRGNVNDWLDLDSLNEATRLQNQAVEIAQKLAADNPEQYAGLPEKVLRERIPLDLTWAMNGRFYQREAELFGKEYLGPKNPLAAAHELFDRYEKYGTKRYNEWGPEPEYEAFKESVYAQYDEEPPVSVPDEFKDVPADHLFIVEEHGLNVTKMNQVMYLEKDAAASNGKALRLPGTNIPWPFSLTEGGIFRLITALNHGEAPKVHAYVFARAEADTDDADADDAVALIAGFHNISTDTDLLSRPVKVSEIKGSEYKMIDAGTFTPGREVFFNIAQPKTTDVVNTWIDRIIFVWE